MNSGKLTVLLNNKIKEQNKFKITKTKKKHIKSINLLLKNSFGKEFIVKNLLKTYFISYVILKDKKVIGCINANIINFQEFKIIFKNSKILDKFKNYNNLGFIHSIVINNKEKGKGLATKLMKKVIKEFKNLNIKIITLSALKTKNGVHLKSVLNKFFFIKIKEFKNFWKADSLLKGYNCPYCGNPCMCSEILYIKEI